MSLSKRAAAEFIGTFWLVFGAVPCSLPSFQVLALAFWAWHWHSG